MAALHVTQATQSAQVQGFDALTPKAVQLEKISCWKGGFFSADPFVFLGHRIRVGELLQCCYDDERGLVDESNVYIAKVLAVHVGLPGDGIETALLLRHDGFSCEDYIPVSKLTILDVLPDPAPAN